MSSIVGIVEIEKHYPVSADHVFAAWVSAEAMLVWSAPPEGWTMLCDSFALEVGHADQWRFGPIGETPYANVNRYTAIEPGRRILYTTTLSHGDKLQFTGAVCVTFETVDAGCRLTLAETGIHIDQDDRDGHVEGWQGMLDGLADYLKMPVAA